MTLILTLNLNLASLILFLERHPTPRPPRRSSRDPIPSNRRSTGPHAPSRPGRRESQSGRYAGDWGPGGFW